MEQARWMKMQRNVSLASFAMMGSFWLAISLPEFWWLGLLMMAYQGQNFMARMKLDTADERAELIAARAGFLSQKLMLGAGIVAFSFRDRLHGGDRGWPLAAVLLIGSFAEHAFRKWLGAEPDPKGGTLLSLIVWSVLAFMVVCGIWVLALLQGWL